MLAGIRTDYEMLEWCGRHLDARLPDLVRKRPNGERLPAPKLHEVLMRTLLKIRNKERRLVWLRPNRAQTEYGDNCTQKNVVLKARQIGITTYIAARFFVQTITQPGTLSVQVAHDQESAEEIFRIVHRFWENLPEGLRKGALRTSRANSRQLVFPKLDSEYRVETAADPNAGRGLTIHHLHCSEVARWPRGGADTLVSLRSAVTAKGEAVLESTPNGAGGVFYEEWQRAEETGYTRHFFPWWYETSYALPDAVVKRLSAEEEVLVVRAGLSLAQIAWRRQSWSSVRGQAPQEFAENSRDCFLASGECVFDVAKVMERMEQSGDPVEAQENGRLLFWLPPAEPHQYIVGVDAAGGGTGGDYACAQVIDRATGMQCAELQGHYPPRELAERVATLARTYHEALVAVERNNHGHAVLAHLVGENYRNLYEENGQLGWLTSAATRPGMIENFVAVLATAPQLFRSRRLLDECRTFVRQEDGSVGAQAGTHDDCVMAMAVALSARKAVVGRLTEMEMIELASLPVVE